MRDTSRHTFVTDFPMAPTAIEAAKQHALRQYPLESCGFVVAGVYHPCVNIAANPRESFRFTSDLYDLALVSGTLEAVIHSHPDGPEFPSADDIRGHLSTGVPWGIIVTNGEHADDPLFLDDFTDEGPSQ